MNLRSFNNSTPYRMVASQKITLSTSSSTQSTSFSANTIAIMVGRFDTNAGSVSCTFNIGSNPTADDNSPQVKSSDYLLFKVSPGQKIAFKAGGDLGIGSIPVYIIELGF